MLGLERLRVGDFGRGKSFVLSCSFLLMNGHEPIEILIIICYGMFYIWLILKRAFQRCNFVTGLLCSYLRLLFSVTLLLVALFALVLMYTWDFFVTIKTRLLLTIIGRLRRMRNFYFNLIFDQLVILVHAVRVILVRTLHDILAIVLDILFSILLFVLFHNLCWGRLFNILVFTLLAISACSRLLNFN